MAESSVFPIHIRAEYLGGKGFTDMERDAESAAARSKRVFAEAFADVRETITRALSNPIRGGAIDLGLGDMRVQAAEARFAAAAIEELTASARTNATATGDTSEQTRAYVQALSSAGLSARQFTQRVDAQLTSMERLQSSLQSGASDNSELARTYRELAESARLAELETRALGVVQETTSRALSLKRNTSGALDLDVKGLTEAADNAEAYAIAAREVAQASRIAAQANGENKAETLAYANAAEKAALAAEENARSVRAQAQVHEILQAQLNETRSATDRVVEAGAAGTQANRQMVNSTQALRQATIQAGQQLQDIAISLYSGQQASVVFAQQLPQLAFALTGLKGNSNETLDAIGGFAEFLSGPWGVAVGLAAGVLLSYSSELLGLVDVTKDATGEAYDFADGLDFLGKSAGRVKEVMDQLGESIRSAIQVQGTYFEQQYKIAADTLPILEKQVAEKEARLRELTKPRGLFDISPPRPIEIYNLTEELKVLRPQIESARELATLAKLASAQREVTAELDASTAATFRYNEAVGKLNSRFKSSQELSDDPLAAASGRGVIMSEAEYKAEFRRLTKIYEDEKKLAEKREGRPKRAPKGYEETLRGDPTEFPLPLDGKITSRFGYRTHPTTGKRAFHNGIDIDGETGDPVKLPAAGVVTAVGVDPISGKFVVVDHGGGTKTSYSHLSRQNVSRGDVLEKGAVVGLVGSTGRSTGSHLHYKVTVNGKAVDPTKGLFGTDSSTVSNAAEKAAREAQKEIERLSRLSDQSAESILRINEQFDDQPRLIDRSTQAVRRLDAIMAELNDEKNKDTPGRERLIANAMEARAQAANAIGLELGRISEQENNRLSVQRLLLAGKEDEARIAERIFAMEEKFGVNRKLAELEAELKVAKEILATADATEAERKAALATIAALTPAYEENLAKNKLIYDQAVRQTLAEKEINEAIKRRNEEVGRYLSVISNTRSALEDLFSPGGNGGDFLKELRNQFGRLRAELTVESIFGDTFRQLEEFTKRNDPVNLATKRLADNTDEAGIALVEFTDAIDAATGRITGAALKADTKSIAANDNQTLGGSAASAALAAMAGAIQGNGEIVVSAGKANAVRLTQDLRTFTRQITDGISIPLLDKLDTVLGTDFFAGLSGVLSGALEGYIRAGKVGAGLGGLQGLFSLLSKDAAGKISKDLIGDTTGDFRTIGTSLKDVEKFARDFDGVKSLVERTKPTPDQKGGEKTGNATFTKIAEGFDKLLSGAQTGDQTAQILRTLGVKTSRTGGQLGGAIGGAAFGPVGEIAGSIIGSVIGGALKKTKKASASIAANEFGELSVGSIVGNSKAFKEQSGDLLGQSIDQINRIAEQLGATVNAGAGSVSLGVRKGQIRLDTSGSGKTKTSKGAIDFGEDAQAAVEAATLDLIKDGVLVGLREGTKVLLQNAKDLEDGLSQALKFEDVFNRLAKRKDPIGFAVNALNREFEGLITLFKKAGASATEYAQLEELYGLERADLIKQAQDQFTSGLKAFLDELTIGDSGLSLSTRRLAAQQAFDPLAAKVRAGERVDADEFQSSAQALLEIERQIFGSQSDYFTRLSDVTALTRKAIETETGLLNTGSGIGSPFSGSTGAANDNVVPVVSAVDAMNDNIASILNAQLGALNGNLLAYLQNNPVVATAGSVQRSSAAAFNLQGF